ncbi:MAG: porin family protein [Brumimicrobium sp.]
MKKALTTILTVGFISTIMTQTMDRREDFVFGLKAGTNYSNVWDEQGEDFVADSKFGFAGGAFFGIPLGTYLGIQPEILVSQKGYKGSGSIPILGDYTYTRTSTHLDIPLQIQLKPSEFITIVAGPQYSYLMQQRSEFTSGESVFGDEEEFDNDNIRKNTMGVVGGVDINISNFVISARAGWDLQTNNGDGTSSNPNYKNHWLQFTAGYMF